MQSIKINSNGRKQAMYSDKFKTQVAEFAKKTYWPYHAIAKQFNISLNSAMRWCIELNGHRRIGSKGGVQKVYTEALEPEVLEQNPAAVIDLLIKNKIEFTYAGNEIRIKV